MWECGGGSMPLPSFDRTGQGLPSDMPLHYSVIRDWEVRQWHVAIVASWK